MSEIIAALNPQQQAAVLAVEGPVLILAGAGSGKTRVITHRIAHLVLDRGIPSDQILAVTFTNKAAQEMQRRVESLLTGQAVRSRICTFHSLCVCILRQEAEAAGLNRDFVIYDEADQLTVVKDALRAFNLAEKLHPPRRLLSRISARKNAGRQEEESLEATDVFSRVVEHYAAALHAAHALDFDDLLLRTVALLEKDARVRERYQRRFPYVLVDEYQDTNRTQYDLIRHLVGPTGHITVVGDEDQSIYSWRGADIQNILDFEQDFPGARILRLEQNYRSSQAILDAAAGLVSHNRRRRGKTLVAVRDSGTPVQMREAVDEFDEAVWVVEKVAALRSQGRVAILYRTNSQSRLFEEALLRLRIPYSVVGGVGFYDRREVKDVIAYLRLILNSRDSLALRRILNVPPRGIGARTVQVLEEAVAEKTVPFEEAISHVEQDMTLPGRVILPLTRFRTMIEMLRTEAPGLSVKALISRTLEATGYAAALAEDMGQESQDRLENLAELLSAASEYDTREPEPTLRGFLDRISLLSDVDSLPDDRPVVLMTLHSAKGLEFDSIFLVGLEEGLIPHSRSLSHADALEEERRLCYVGMTRAMDRLHLSWAQSRMVYGQRRTAEPSRFLEEIPRKSVEWSSALRARTPSRRQQDSWTRPEPRLMRVSPSPTVHVTPFKTGARVRHPLFGVGTVVQAEGSGDELKLTVSFLGVGAKRLVARYAGLEEA